MRNGNFSSMKKKITISKTLKNAFEPLDCNVSLQRNSEVKRKNIKQATSGFAFSAQRLRRMSVKRALNISI